MLKEQRKRGLSPVVATILLVAIAVVLAIIILLWARGFLKEKTQKFNEPIENSCERVIFEAEAYQNSDNPYIDVVNKGSIPIHGFEILKKETGKVSNLGAFVFSAGGGSDNSVLYGGENGRLSISSTSIATGDTLELAPILIGEKGSEYVSFACDKKYGQEIKVNA